MALQPAQSFTRSGTSAILAKTAHEERVIETRQIPFDLRPLLEPYKHVGKVTLRVEKIPQRGRLSAGKNNGNQSWSLTADELEGLLYILPADIDEPHSLGIRIISQVDGTSVAVLSYRVFPKEISTVVEKAPTPPRIVNPALLREQLAQAEDRVKQTEAQAFDRLKLTEAQAEERLKRTEVEWQQKTHELVDQALKQAKVDWDTEFSERLNTVVERAEQTLVERRAAWQSELDTSLAEANKRAEATLVQARESWKRDADAALLATRESWKSEEAARLAAAEMKWRGDVRSAEGDAQAKLEKNEYDSAEFARLREQIAATERAAQVRDRELATARSELEAAQANAQAAAEALLARAKAGWTTDESKRLSELETRLRAEHEAALAEASGRRDRAERALSETVKQIERLSAMRAEGATGEVESLRANLAVSHAAAAQAVKDAEARLEEAHARWKAEEEIRVAAAEARVRAEAVTTSKEVSELRLRAEAALVEARQKALLAESEEKKRAEIEEELRALGVSLKSRDTELFETREQARQSADAALGEARKEWASGEATRLKEAEARLRGELERALYEAGQRAETAERQFAELKAQGDANPQERVEILRLHDELERMRLTIDARDAEIKSARMEFNASLFVAPPPPVTRTVYLERVQEEKKQRRNLVRDAALVAATVFVTALVPFSRPWIEPYLPDYMQEQLDQTFGVLYVPAPAKPAKPRPVAHAATATQAAAAPVPATETALRETDLHSAPSDKAVVLATLPVGSKVQVLDDDGNWVHVFVGPTATGQDGWVHHADLSAPSR